MTQLCWKVTTWGLSISPRNKFSTEGQSMWRSNTIGSGKLSIREASNSNTVLRSTWWLICSPSLWVNHSFSVFESNSALISSHLPLEGVCWNTQCVSCVVYSKRVSRASCKVHGSSNNGSIQGRRSTKMAKTHIAWNGLEWRSETQGCLGGLGCRVLGGAFINSLNRSPEFFFLDRNQKEFR